MPARMIRSDGGKREILFFIIILGILIVGGGWFGISKYSHALHHEETDDAQVSADIIPVIPRVAGYVNQVLVRDNQQVKKGDTLLILDDRDYKLKLEQAEGALETAKINLESAKATTTAARANIATSQASVGTVDAQIEAAKVNVWRATQDYERYANLIKDHSVTQQQYEQALAAKQTAEKQLAILQEQKNQASATNTCRDATKQRHCPADQCCQCSHSSTPDRCRCCQIESFIYGNYGTAGWNGFKSKCTGGTICKGRTSFICCCT